MTTILKQNLKRCTKQPQRDIKMTQKRNNNKIPQRREILPQKQLTDK